jgi:predicted transcriptional regulator
VGERRLWTKKEEKYLKENAGKITQENIAKHLGRTKASIENKFRYMGIQIQFSEKEKKKLAEMWGKPRKVLEKAFPKYTYRQLAKKAGHMGLPNMVEAADVISIWSLCKLLGLNYNVVMRDFIKLGLVVKNYGGEEQRSKRLVVEIDDFWDFAMAHPELIDLKKVTDIEAIDLVGAPPLELWNLLKKYNPPTKPERNKAVKGMRKKDILYAYYHTEMTTEEIGRIYKASSDTIRHVACESDCGLKRKRPGTVVNKSFLIRLKQMMYTENKTYKECAEELNCSVSSVYRGLKKIAAGNKEESRSEEECS